MKQTDIWMGGRTDRQIMTDLITGRPYVGCHYFIKLCLLKLGRCFLLLRFVIKSIYGFLVALCKIYVRVYRFEKSNCDFCTSGIFGYPQNV